jgi:hypothetical protein
VLLKLLDRLRSDESTLTLIVKLPVTIGGEPSIGADDKLEQLKWTFFFQRL